MSSYDLNRLVPLLGQYTEINSPRGEQWIFPTLQFTCYGTLTKWIFTGVPGQPTTSCRVELETWRLDTSSTISTVYEQISTTERDIVTVTQDGPIFTYELTSLVPVKVGDIVGIELGHLCALLEDFDNIPSLNVSSTGSSNFSYRQDRSGATFFLHSSSITPEQDFVPLIEAVVGKKLRVNVHISFTHVFAWLQQ